MYAQVTNREAYPLGWEQSEWLFKKLKRLTFDAHMYQFVWERRLFAIQYMPEVRAVLVKWSRDDNGQKIREVIVETDDQQVMASALTMLVAVAEDEMKARGEVTHGVKWV